MVTGHTVAMRSAGGGADALDNQHASFMGTITLYMPLELNQSGRENLWAASGVRGLHLVTFNPLLSRKGSKESHGKIGIKWKIPCILGYACANAEDV